MFTTLDYSSALEYSIIRRYTKIVHYYYYYYLTNIKDILKHNAIHHHIHLDNIRYEHQNHDYKIVCRLVTYYLHISALIMKFYLCNLNVTNSFRNHFFFKYYVHFTH